MAEGRLSLGTEVRRLRLGDSFSRGSSKNFHTFRYDFKPASMDTKKVATVEIGATNQATVTVPHVEGSGTAHTVFKGSRKPYTKECVLIIDNVTGEIVLEKLNSNVQLKKTRTEATRKQPNPHSQLQRPSTPIEGSGNTSTTSHSSKRTPSSPPRSKHSSPVHHYHGSQTSLSSPVNLLTVNQRSPVNQLSPSMPSLIAPNSNSNNATVKTSVPSMPMIFGGEDEEEQQQQQVIGGGEASDAASEVGFLSDSSNNSSSGSSSSSSSTDSSDNENDEKETSNRAPPPMKLSVPTNSQQSSNSFPSMPQFSQLTEDLELSESGSDSDS